MEVLQVASEDEREYVCSTENIMVEYVTVVVIKSS